jgi:hypothetical protein
VTEPKEWSPRVPESKPGETAESRMRRTLDENLQRLPHQTRDEREEDSGR